MIIFTWVLLGELVANTRLWNDGEFLILLDMFCQNNSNSVFVIGLMVNRTERDCNLLQTLVRAKCVRCPWVLQPEHSVHD